MERSTLKLIVEKGPREGVTLDCVPKSTIRIGRVVKGNTFAIKDAGISSKHLLIKFKDGKWVISDLDTSNGTILNGVKLRGMVDFDLEDGDVIKIGEWTSFKVEIEDETTKPKKIESVDVEIPEKFDAEHGESRFRRNPRRRVATNANRVVKEDNEASESQVSKMNEISNLGAKYCKGIENVAVVVDNQTGRRGGRGGARVAKDEASEPALVSFSQVEKISGISNLGARNCEGIENVAVVADNPTRRRVRGRPKIAKDEPVATASASIVEVQKNSESSNIVLESVREPENLIPAEEKRTRRGAPRKIRASKDIPVATSEVQKIPESPNAGGENCKVDNVAPLAQRQTQRVAVKRTRVKKKDETVDPVAEMPKVLENLSIDESNNLDRMEENQAQGVTQARINDSQDQPSGSVRIPVSEVLEVPEKSYLQEETCNESVNTAAEENPVPLDSDKVGNIIDWEKMTLGEWFDYLEVYLPRQIHEATDEIILSMRERSKRFNEFMSQQQNGKGKLSFG